MDALQELNELTGLHSVKQQIEDLISLIDVNKERALRGLKESEVSHHMAFLGSPGTGKTTVARLVGRIFKDLGILSSGHLIEADREKLVGQYIGHTEYKTTELINQAQGGVLFIDEAYSLFKEDSPRDFGNEALSTLIKRMEDDRTNFIVIFAGYGDETKQMIQSNPGLKSRIALHIYFPDYTPDELIEIFSDGLMRNNLLITEDTLQLVYKTFYSIWENRDKDFGNARMVRNFLELIHRVQARRLSHENIANKTDDQLKTVTTDDVRAALSLYLSQNLESDTDKKQDIEPLTKQEKPTFWQKLKPNQKSLRNQKNSNLNRQLQQILISSEHGNRTFLRWGLIFLLIAVLFMAYYFQTKPNDNADYVQLIDYNKITNTDLEELKGNYSGYFYSLLGKSKAAIEITEYHAQNKLLKAYVNVYSGALQSRFSNQRQIIFGLDSTYSLASENYFPAKLKTDLDGTVYLVSINDNPAFSFIKLPND